MLPAIRLKRPSAKSTIERVALAERAVEHLRLALGADINDAIVAVSIAPCAELLPTLSAHHDGSDSDATPRLQDDGLGCHMSERLTVT